MKLAVNLVVHDLNAAVSEALIIAKRAGIAAEDAYDVFQDSVIAAPFVVYKRAAFLDPETPVAMSLDLVHKDLRLITGLADELGVPVPRHRCRRPVRGGGLQCRVRVGGHGFPDAIPSRSSDFTARARRPSLTHADYETESFAFLSVSPL